MARQTLVAGVGGTIRANGDTTLVGVLTATKMVVKKIVLLMMLMNTYL